MIYEMKDLTTSNGTEKITFVKSGNTLSIIQKKFKIDYSKVESLEQVIDILNKLDKLGAL